MNTPLKHFAIKVTWFIPLLLLFLLPLIILLRSNEFVDIETVVQKQNQFSTPFLFGLAYTDQTNEYKYRSVLTRNASVLSVGSSRSMQFRSKFFITPSSFFNAGMVAPELSYIAAFIDAIPQERSPKIIILSLDQVFFNKNHHIPEELHTTGTFRLNTQSLWTLLTFRKVFIDLVSGKIPISRMITPPKYRIGIQAVVHDDGFENDGSRYYGKIIKSPEKSSDYQFKDSLQRIANQEGPFEHGDTVSQDALRVLNNILSECSKKHIYVIGVLPAFAPTVFNKLQMESSDYAYMFKLYDSIHPIFSSYSFPLFDFTNPEPLHVSDSEFIDGFHGSDTVYLAMMIHMVKNNDVLAQYSDINALEKLEVQKISNLQVVPYGSY